MKKIIIPTFIEYNACQFTIDGEQDFLKFITSYSYQDSVKITYKWMKDKQIPVEITFKWNPYEWDYSPTIKVKLNQYFMYEDEDPDNYKILDPEEISSDWYIYHASKN